MSESCFEYREGIKKALFMVFFVDKSLSMWNLAKNLLPMQFLLSFIILPPHMGFENICYLIYFIEKDDI